MLTHFGADSVADGFSSKVFAVFGLPLILLMTQFICVFFTLRDQNQRNQSQKALRIVFWIIPAISLATSGSMYRFALGGDFQLSIVLALPLAAMFLLLGNYLPKIKQNNTLGIKISWTLTNEENWNKTHRFAGTIWIWITPKLTRWNTGMISMSVPEACKAGFYFYYVNKKFEETT